MGNKSLKMDSVAPKKECFGGTKMSKYVCDVCGWVYDPIAGDPENGVPPGTPWEKVPDNWVCPVCGVGKTMFSKIEE